MSAADAAEPSPTGVPLAAWVAHLRGGQAHPRNDRQPVRGSHASVDPRLAPEAAPWATGDATPMVARMAEAALARIDAEAEAAAASAAAHVAEAIARAATRSAAPLPGQRLRPAAPSEPDPGHRAAHYLVEPGQPVELIPAPPSSDLDLAAEEAFDAFWGAVPLEAPVRDRVRRLLQRAST